MQYLVIHTLESEWEEVLRKLYDCHVKRDKKNCLKYREKLKEIREELRLKVEIFILCDDDDDKFKDVKNKLRFKYHRSSNTFFLKLIDRLYINTNDRYHPKRTLSSEKDVKMPSEEKSSMELLSKRLCNAIFYEVGDHFKGGVKEMKIKMNEKLE